ncbi:MAG: hypothetical protein NTZ33_14035 [Bacteroidetes bacterium]|nr:hypothetical protein [Bacteroidota bacterium]
MARAYSTNSLFTKNFKTYDFKGSWEKSFGKPGRGGIWFVSGDSGNGKTSFVLQLCKYMTNFGKVLYDSFEEGFSLTMQLSCKRAGLDECGSRFLLLDKEPIPDLIIRLHKRKSAEIVVIDSSQYSQMKYKDYILLKDTFRNKTFIIISQVDGKLPSGSLAKRIRFDSDVKIFIEKYKAFIEASRFGGDQEPFIIWKEGADKYWNKQI